MTNTILQLFVILTIVTAAHLEKNTKSSKDDYQYIHDANAWIKLHRVPATWADAERRCHTEGGVLVSPLDNELLSVMKEHMSNIPQCGVFTGIHATFSNGDYTSVEGVPLAKIPIQWAPNEPDNYGNNERCLILLTNGTVADVHCEELYPYICFRRILYTADNSCRTSDPNYKYVSRTNSCYKFHREPIIWPEAFKTCAGEGGHLAIINSDLEAEIIKDLFKENPADKMIGNFYKDVALIGFHDWGVRGQWRTVHGETLQVAGFNKFSSGQPDNATNGEFCGSIFRTGLLNDIWCDKPHAFICEISLAHF